VNPLKLITLLLACSVLTMGCASKSVDLKGRTVSSYLEDFKTDELNAHQRLDLLVQNIEELKDSMDRSAPRYYLLENFLERTQSLFSEISQYEGDSMEQSHWVPEDIAVAPKFHRIVAAYEVMDKAARALALDPLVVGFDKNTNLNLETLDYILGEYKKRIEVLRASELASVTEEAYEKIQARETRDLIHYLARRIESHYENVVPRKSHKKRVDKMLKWAFDGEKLSGKNPKRFYDSLRRFTRSYTYKKAMYSLKDLSLPESGNIEGSEDSFNQVNSVQVCADILNQVAKSYLQANR
jgi:hypothetical protein